VREGVALEGAKERLEQRFAARVDVQIAAPPFEMDNEIDCEGC
jgi:hypothetical protein